MTQCPSIYIGIQCSRSCGHAGAHAASRRPGANVRIWVERPR